LALVVGGAAGLYRLDAPGVLVEREFKAQVIARDYLFERTPTVPDWRRTVADVTRKNVPIVEPPVIEWVASLIYEATGTETVGAVRVLTSTLWLGGSLFMFRVAHLLAGLNAAVFATMYVRCPELVGPEPRAAGAADGEIVMTAPSGDSHRRRARRRSRYRRGRAPGAGW
jgi:hypothetical protein